MSTNTQLGILASVDRSLTRSEQRHTIDSFGEWPFYSKYVLTTGEETNNFLDSGSTSNSEIWGKGSDTSRLELQCSIYQPTPPPRPVTVLAEQKAHLMHKRTQPSRRQQLYLDWLTAYRVLIASVILTNIGVFIPIQTNHPSAEMPLAAAAANIMVAVLLRQEEVINFSFKCVSKLPPTLPFAVRRAISNFHHYGGVHVGCAVSALLWYCMFVGLDTIRVIDLIKLDKMYPTLYIDVVTAYVALLAILLVCATAVPRFRVRFHNTFEATHRFAGWGVLVVLWIHAGIATLAPGASIPLYSHPFIWMLTVTTLLIIYPWLRIRRIPIMTFPISTHEVQLTFPYNSMPYTSTIKTSTAPLTEWHAFATIPISSTTSKIIISQAGDWTKSIIASPPTELWIRHPPTFNFLTLAPLFNSLLLVATGAGIGPILSLLTSPALTNMRQQGREIRVLWCAYEPFAPQWAFVLDTIRNVDKNAKVFDSKAGRPDMAFEARYLAETTSLEAVMVVSNPKVTKSIIDECKMHRIASYGAVFDS